MSLQSQLDVILEGTDNLSPVLQRAESQLIRFVGAAASAVAAIKSLAFPVLEAASFEREVANVTKTTNFSTEQVKQLSAALLDLSTHVDVSANDLAKIAAAAGQQGLGKFGVAGVVTFTESVARMASVLDLSAEEAASATGKILNIFKIPIGDIERISSAFNQVSNNSTAKGAELLDVVKRIGDAAGTLNLQQSIGLGAAGIDLGLSPEVAGTSINRIFSNLTIHSKEFAQLLNRDLQGSVNKVTPDSFLSDLKTKSIDTFKRVLTALGNTKDGDAASAIVKLLGGGRTKAAIDKFIEDSRNGNAILNRDQNNAATGFSEGTSSLREQLTVLATLQAQYTILQNVVKKTAIDFANVQGTDGTGPTLVQKLTVYVVELQAQLQKPGTKAFLTEVAQGFLSLIDAVANVIKFVANLNINWEVFLKLGLVAAFLKLAEGVGILALRIPGVALGVKLLGDQYKNATKSAAEFARAELDAAAAADKLGKSRGPSAVAEQLQNAREGAPVFSTGLQKAAGIRGAPAASSFTENVGAILNAIPGVAQFTAIRREQAAATDLAAAAEKRLADAIVVETAAVAADKAARSRVTQAVDASINTRAAVQDFGQSQKAADAAVIAAQNARNEALLQKEREHLTQIETLDIEYEAQKAARRTTGNTTELRNIEEQHSLRVEDENTFYANSLRSTETYYAREIELAQIAQADVRLIAAEGNAQLLADQKIAQSNLLNARSNAAVTGGVVATAGGDTIAARAAVAEAGVAAEAAGGKFRVLAGALGVLAAGFRTLIGAIFPVLGVLFLVYTALDAFGIIEKITPYFQKLSDAIGLTSARQREQAQQQADDKRKLDEKTKAIQDQIKAYNDLANAPNGNTQKTNINASLSDITNAVGPDAQAKAVQQFANASIGSGAAVAEAPAAGTASLDKVKSIANDITVLYGRIIAGQNKIADNDVATAARIRTAQTSGSGLAALDVQYIQETADRNKAAATAEINANKAKLTTLQTDIATYAANAQTVLTSGLQSSLEGNQAFVEATTHLFTDASAKVFQDNEVRLNDVQKRHDDAKAALDEANSKSLLLNNSKPGTKEATDAAADAENKRLLLNAINVESTKVNADINKQINDLIANLGNLAPAAATAAKNALEFARTQLFTLTPELRTNFSNSLFTAQGQGAKLDGAAVPVDPKTKNAGAAFQVTKESEAEKIAKAELELAKAHAAALAEIGKASNDEQLQIQQQLYDRGLESLNDFYATKRKAAQDDANFDISRLSDELTLSRAASGDGPAQKGVTKLTAKADIIREQAKAVKIEADLEVVLANKDKTEEQFTELARKAKEQFDDAFHARTLELTIKLGTTGTGPADITNLFNESITVAEEKNRELINRLQTEANALLDTGKTVEAGQLTQQIALIRSGEAVDALTTSFSVLNRQTALIEGNLARASQVFDILKTQGSLTSTEVDILNDQARKNAIPLLEDQIKGLQSAQNDFLNSGRGDESSLAYKELGAQVADAQVKLFALKNTADQTAQDINKSFVDNFASILDNIEDLTDKSTSFFDKVKAGALSFVKTLQSTLNKSIAENVQNQLFGGGGNGGIGGLFSNALKTIQTGIPSTDTAAAAEDAVGVPGAQATDAAKSSLPTFLTGILGALSGAKAAPRGSDAGHPLYVQDVSKIPGKQEAKNAGKAAKEGSDAAFPDETKDDSNARDALLNRPAATPATDPAEFAALDSVAPQIAPSTADAGDFAALDAVTPDLSGLGDQIAGKFDGVAADVDASFGNVTDSIATSFGGVTDDLSSGFGDLLGTLGDSFSGLVSDLSGTLGSFFSSLGSSGGGGGDDSGGGVYGSILDAIVSLFHTGGTVGNPSGMSRSVNPAVFAGAYRYHEGTPLAGLKPGEVPAILQTGEKVTTVAQQIAEAKQGGAPAAGDQTNHVSININAADGTGDSKTSPEQYAQFGQNLKTLVVQQLLYEKRPGGLLSAQSQA